VTLEGEPLLAELQPAEGPPVRDGLRWVNALERTWPTADSGPTPQLHSRHGAPESDSLGHGGMILVWRAYQMPRWLIIAGTGRTTCRRGRESFQRHKPGRILQEIIEHSAISEGSAPSAFPAAAEFRFVLRSMRVAIWAEKALISAAFAFVNLSAAVSCRPNPRTTVRGFQRQCHPHG